jgi:preprotein translocase subunit SecD
VPIFKKRLLFRLFFIIILFGVALVMVLPQGKKIIKKEFPLSLGLDLQGGAHLVYELDLSKIEKSDWQSAQESTLRIIRDRVDKFGVGEPVIQSLQVSGKRAILVELPGIKDLDQAKKLIGKTAQLEFWEEDTLGPKESKENKVLPGFKPTGLTGKQLKKATPQVDPNTQSWEVGLEFNAEGALLFKDITKRNLGKPVAIVLDETPISMPTVQTTIEGGKAVITGKFTPQEAKNLAIQLNAGALPVPIKIIEERTVEATLGKESIEKSIVAGLIGLFLVALYMLINYRYWGFWAVVALVIYTVLNLWVYKILHITLTLSGIAGFILSIGMAVDANILIFSRSREELAQGKDMISSVEEGFSRAWLSIRDSNVSSLITAFILYSFGTGQVRGFAVTLSIGILLSMFSAITITRTFLLAFAPKKSYEKTI